MNIDSEQIRIIVNRSCTCGGKGLDDGCCPACEVWHRMGLSGDPAPQPTPAAAASQGERLAQIAKDAADWIEANYNPGPIPGPEPTDEDWKVSLLTEALRQMPTLIAAHCAAREESLRRELQEAHKPWSVTLLVTTKEDPFGRYPCKVVDRGFADKIITVESEHLEELQARLTASESEVAGLRAAGDWLFTALNLAEAENTMCLDHFREADMAEWVKGLMTVRGKIRAALDQWTAAKGKL